MTLPGQHKPSRLTAAQLGISVPAADAPAGVRDAESVPLTAPAQNTIYFGPPGVGKSHAVDQQTKGWHRHRTVFHPEYAAGDFVGTYRPVVLRDESETIRVNGHDVSRYVNTFAFVPGPLVDALADAYGHPGEPVALVIEEINRGDCAAIFGPFFQLLDRVPEGERGGQSEYAINVDPALTGHLRERGVPVEDGVRFPNNLSLFATMNTADQSLFPMDAAFKRRWSWRSVELMAGAGKLESVRGPVRRGTRPVDPPPRRAQTGRSSKPRRTRTSRSDPGTSGFERDRDGRRTEVVQSDLRDKLLFYLWNDVFRNHRGDFFDPDLKRFDDLQARYDNRTIRGVLNKAVREQLDRSTSEAGGDLDADVELAGDPGDA